MDQTRFTHTLAILDREIEEQAARLERLRAERDELASEGKQTPSFTPKRPMERVKLIKRLTIRQAIANALEGGEPLTVAEIVDKLDAMPLKSKVTQNIIRSTLHRLKDEEGWRKGFAHGKGVQWVKPKGSRAAEEASS